MTSLVGPADPESLQTKKQEFVRHELWVVAMELFAETGFDETTIEQIAARAAVSRRTFFRYFPSKEAVMSLAVKGYGEALTRAIREQPAGMPLFEMARAVVRRVAELAASSAYAARTVSIVERSPAARSAQLLELPVIEDKLELAFAEHAGESPRGRLIFRQLASITLSTTTLSIYRWVQQPDRPIGEVVDEAFASLASICCPQQQGSATERL